MQSIKDVRGRVHGGQAHRDHRGVPHAHTHGSNNVYRRLRECGYQVFAVNRAHGMTVIDGGSRLLPRPPPTPGGLGAPRLVAASWLRSRGFMQKGGVVP
jgi:hypothetical protein